LLELLVNLDVRVATTEVAIYHKGEQVLLIAH